MTDENVLQTLQKFIQDVLAPDVRELKVEIASLRREMDARFREVDRHFDVILAAIAEARAHNELVVTRAVAGLAERVAMLEAKQR